MRRRPAGVVLASLITLLMPYLLGQLPGAAIFTFFACMMVLQLVFVLTLMPETKGRSLERIAADLARHG